MQRIQFESNVFVDGDLPSSVSIAITFLLTGGKEEGLFLLDRCCGRDYHFSTDLKCEWVWRIYINLVYIYISNRNFSFQRTIFLFLYCALVWQFHWVFRVYISSWVNISIILANFDVRGGGSHLGHGKWKCCDQ